jgi:hypothetical protein
MVLLVKNIIEKMTNIVTFNHIGILSPLYVENFTIIESNTRTIVNIKTKISEFFLDRFKLVRQSIFSFVVRNRLDETNIVQY